MNAQLKRETIVLSHFQRGGVTIKFPLLRFNAVQTCHQRAQYNGNVKHVHKFTSYATINACNIFFLQVKPNLVVISATEYEAL